MFESLTRFIPLLDREGDFGARVVDHGHAGAVDDPIRFPFVEYSRTVSALESSIMSFVDKHPELCLTRYADILEKAGLDWGCESMEGTDVSALDGKTVMALLVGAVRAERFCDGALMGFLESGCIESWLRRLRQIDEGMGAEKTLSTYCPECDREGWLSE